MTVVTATSVSDLPEQGMAWLIDEQTGEVRAAFYDGHILAARANPQGNTEATVVL